MVELNIVNSDFQHSLKHEIEFAKKKLGKPGYKLVGAMEAVLHAVFLDTQARTHVITGSLKASGTSESDYDGDGWKGNITYGGVSTGPNNPVDYAIYEMARGGEHDFFGNIPEFYPAFEAAITKHMLAEDV